MGGEKCQPQVTSRQFVLISLVFLGILLTFALEIPTHNNSERKPSEGELYPRGRESGIVQCHIVVCHVRKDLPTVRLDRA